MKNYIKKISFLAIFVAIMFLGNVKNADAFGLNIGFGFAQSSFYNNGFGYGARVPINCFNAGYPCNGYFGGDSINNFYANNYYDPYFNSPINYTSYHTYGNYGYGYNNGYTMTSPTYYNNSVFTDYAPTRTYGGYTQPRMYSTWYGY